MKTKKLKNKWSLVTGASSGIGREMALKLASYGSHVVLTARRVERLEELKQKIEKEYAVQVFCLPSDLCSPHAAEELVQAIENKQISIQILINNAGAAKYGPFHRYSLNEHLDSIQLNVTSLTALSYLVVQHMLAHGKPSYVLNVASLAAIIGIPNYAVYSATKRYVRHFSEVLRYELRDSGIHIACLCPGGTMTEFMEQANQKLASGTAKMMMSPVSVAQVGIEGMLAKKALIIPGFTNRWLRRFERLLPSAWLMPVSHKVMSYFTYPQLKEPKS